MDCCRWVADTNLQNVRENGCGRKSLQFSTTREICTINGMQTLMDLQYIQIIYIDERMHLCSQKEKEQALA